MKIVTILALVCIMAMIDQLSAQQIPDDPIPPKARKAARIDSLHGDVRVDDYYWLREKSNPEVNAYLEAENHYTEEMTIGIDELRETLYKEIISRIKQTDLSVPYRLGGCWYYTRTEEGKQYAIYCRKKGTM